MLHGPCGNINPDQFCCQNEKKKCMKFFPKNFQEQTTIENGKFPLYRRRANGSTFTVRTKYDTYEIDSRWVIPYNPYLLKKYDCHINIEYCVNAQAIKYINKYITKGIQYIFFYVFK